MEIQKFYERLNFIWGKKLSKLRPFSFDVPNKSEKKKESFLFCSVGYRPMRVTLIVFKFVFCNFQCQPKNCSQSKNSSFLAKKKLSIFYWLTKWLTLSTMLKQTNTDNWFFNFLCNSPPTSVYIELMFDTNHGCPITYWSILLQYLFLQPCTHARTNKQCFYCFSIWRNSEFRYQKQKYLRSELPDDY